VTGFLPRNRPSGQWPLRGLATAGAAGAVIALAACGSQSPGSGAPDEHGTVAAQSAAPDAISMEVGDSMDVINARIPAPPEGSDMAQAEMTLADTSTVGPDTLRAASSPAARAVVFTSNGHTVPQITIPVADGSGLTTGPPNPDRILLTGLRRPLRAGQTVTISLAFARAGHATLRIPVIPSAP
jgi:copper(I)-binding protein